MRVFSVILVLNFFLAACSYASIDGLRVLSALSPLEADPAQIAVALNLPDGVRVDPGSARITIEARRDEMQISDAFALIGQQVGPAQVWRIADADVARMRVVQSLVRRWKAEDKDTSGSISVHAAICTIGIGPLPDAGIDISIRTETGGAFIPLLRDAPLSALAGRDVIGTPAPCPDQRH